MEIGCCFKSYSIYSIKDDANFMKKSAKRVNFAVSKMDDNLINIIWVVQMNITSMDID